MHGRTDCELEIELSSLNLMNCTCYCCRLRRLIDVDGLLHVPMLACLDLQKNSISHVPPELGKPKLSIEISKLLIHPLMQVIVAWKTTGKPAVCHLQDVLVVIPLKKNYIISCYSAQALVHTEAKTV